MELTLLSFNNPKSIYTSTSYYSPSILRKLPRCTKSSVLCCSCSSSSSSSSNDSAKLTTLSLSNQGRRALFNFSLFAGFCIADVAAAVSTSRRALRGAKIPESEFKALPNGLKYYDIKVGGGAEAVKGSRVAVHYVAKWKGITFMTSRQGMGVGGGTPYGFDVGQSERGAVLKGLDLGVQGMKVGGQVNILVSAVIKISDSCTSIWK